MPRGVYPRKKGAKLAVQVKVPLAWYWREDRGMYRVWRSDWYTDQFDVLNVNEFRLLLSYARRLSIPLMEAADEE